MKPVENTEACPLLRIGAASVAVDLPSLGGPAFERLPVVLRLLLENVARNMQGAERSAATAALRAWPETATSEAEIAFQPGRVLMHDTTSTPALVDLAAMRSTLAEAGVDPALLNSSLPVDVSVDHSLAVEAFARPDAPALNMAFEIRRNAERYTFLRWASKVLRGVRIHPPGTGIMHTINLEQLATVVTAEAHDGVDWLVPDMMIGTDSHTPMVGGIGVLGWGVGGLEAQTVMFGLPTMLRIPDVVGVRLSGALRAGVLATDLALTVTQRLRAIGVSGEFVEFFGAGVATLSAGERCVVANMAPEYGATTGYFPVDERTLDYLKQTGRTAAHVDRARAYLKATALWFDPAAEPRFTRTIHIDLDAVDMHVAGPRRPQDLLGFGETRAALTALGFEPKADAGAMPKHPIAIAAITSCTNTSDPRLLIAAGLLARKARALGLSVPPWVKTSTAPGSPAAAACLERAGLTQDLAAVGFDIVGYGCTTCIGNAGPLPELIKSALAQGAVHPVAVLSGNRNFPGRVHPDLDLGFLMSPPLVVAFALAGDAQRDLRVEPVQRTADGVDVYLKDLWPSREEVDAALAAAQDPADYRRAFAIASANPGWHALEAPGAPLYPWDAASTALRRPPFAALGEGSLLGRYAAWPLLVVGDDITTDHISPASAIPPDSLVADFLVERGDDRNDLNVFASRRGNWEVMVRAAFHNKTLRNLLAPNAPVAHTLHQPSGQIVPLWEAAQRYRAAGESVVLLAGERYGTGSSRDWAAKGQRLLGIRAVLANSFERIHRSNL
ncbi:MAG TPA: aconitate hydratase AcnA, partial [Rubrivivax sp.]